MTEELYKIGWELTKALGTAAVHWKVEDHDLEVWAGERYFVVVRFDPDTFIVTEEDEKDHDVMVDRKAWRDWTDAARDVLDRIKRPRP